MNVVKYSKKKKKKVLSASVLCRFFVLVFIYVCFFYLFVVFLIEYWSSVLLVILDLSVNLHIVCREKCFSRNLAYKSCITLKIQNELYL